VEAVHAVAAPQDGTRHSTLVPPAAHRLAQRDTQPPRLHAHSCVWCAVTDVERLLMDCEITCYMTHEPTPATHPSFCPSHTRCEAACPPAFPRHGAYCSSMHTADRHGSTAAAPIRLPLIPYWFTSPHSDCNCRSQAMAHGPGSMIRFRPQGPAGMRPPRAFLTQSSGLLYPPGSALALAQAVAQEAPSVCVRLSASFG
jgi:hypothetical protein